MDEVLLLGSRLALVLTGAGGAAAVIVAASRRRIAWVPAVAAALVLLGFAATALVAADSPPAVLSMVGLPWFIGFPLLAATFPDGRLVPRWSIWVVVVSAALEIADIATGFRLHAAPWWSVVAVWELLAAGAFIVWRYRRSATTAERERLRWVVLGVVVTVTAFMVILVVDGVIGAPTAASTAKANLAGIPLAVGLVVAAAWPRVRNVDAVFRGVLVVLGAGWAMGGAFAGGAGLARAGGADPATATTWGAVVIALVAYPVIRLASRTATWLVFRDRLTPDVAVALLASELDSDSVATVADRVVTVARKATASPLVRLTAAIPTDAMDFDAESATDGASTSTLQAFPVSFRGEVLAMLAAAPRAGESELSARDRASLSAIAHHAGPALHGARALRTATHAQAELVVAREEERRRLRRELHDDLGPTLTGLALSAAAISHQARSTSPPLADAARELHEGIGDAVTRSREIAHGLRPAILDDRGLSAAIHDRVGGASDVQLHIAETGDLPAAVSLAALRIVQEAVANTRRHAAASTCRVAVARERGGLRIEVVDDGVGLPQTPVAGAGLRSIRERAAELGGSAQITRPERGGTSVSVWLPTTEPAQVAS